MLFLSTITYADDLVEETKNIHGAVGPIVVINESLDYEHVGIQKLTQRSRISRSEVTGLFELKDEINEKFKNYEKSFTIVYNGDTGNLKEEIRRLIDEIKIEDEYFSGTYSSIGYGYEYNSSWAEINFNIQYLTNETQEEFVDFEVKRVVGDIIKPGMDDFKKVKSINDWIVLNTEYSEDTNSSPHAAYTLFDEGKGVCQAYALAAYRLLEEAGLQVRYVTGKAGNSESNLVGHAWNQVKIYGRWYNLDTTWNDPSPNNPGQVSYAYFLMSDESLEIDHFKDNLRIYEVADDNSYEYMNEMSHAVTLDNYIYYSSRDNDNKLYKNKIGTKEKTKLVDNRSYYIIVYGDWIYYSNYSNGGYLYKVRTNGTENTRLNEVHSTNLYISLPYLYYDNVNSKEKIRIDESVNVAEGYDLLPLNEEKRDPKYMWKVRLNKPVKAQTVNFNSVYVENEYGEKLDKNNFSIEISKDDPALININVTNGTGYLKNRLYYIVVDKTLQSLDNKYLVDPIKMPFIIK